VSFIAAPAAADIVAEGRILSAARHRLREARITDGADRLLAVGRATYMILAAR